MYKSIGDVPVGVLVTVSTGLLRCSCGVTVFGARYDARATDEYAPKVDGRLRRKFTFDGDNPFCGCANCIWLADTDGPFVADGWPVRAYEDVPLIRKEE